MHDSHFTLLSEKMKLEIDVVSREMVTPSSPTPLHLNNYKLSFLDQIMSHVLMTLVFFYPSNNNNPISNSERSNHLKKSLSKALSQFYPLAGRLVGNSYVNCNDEGVSYVEAQANCKLSDFMTDPIQEELEKFVPCDLEHDARDLCLVQVTFFNCGGLAIGLGISHKLVDAVSTFMFVNSWAAFSRGDDHIQSPIFESATLFPPRDLSSERILKNRNKEHFVNKRFVFTAEKISMLRDKYTKNTNGEGFIRPTRIETLSAFIWTRFMVATGAKGDTNKVYVLLHYVDIRTRLDPPLSKNHFGNLILRTIAVPSLENEEESTYGLVKKLRDAIRDVEPDSVLKIPEGDESLDALKIKGQVKMELEGKVDVVRFSSLCRQPINESDFGWGKPVWVELSRIHTCKMVHFMDSISGGGIDALVNLKEEDMAKFEADEELNQYVACGDSD